MYVRQRGAKGPPGGQGERGPPGPAGPPGKLLARYITSGGSRSLRQEEFCTVILDTEERVNLLLPKLPVDDTIVDDMVYYPFFVTIYCQKGVHCLSASDKKINRYFSSVELSELTRYDLISTPVGWSMMIFKSDVDL